MASAMLIPFAFMLNVVSAANWHYTTMDNVTSMIGISSINSKTVYGAVTDNDQGPGVMVSSDGGATDAFFGPVGWLNLDIAMNKAGEGVLVGLGSIYTTNDNAKTFNKMDVFSATQSVDAFGDHSFGAAGTFTPKLTEPPVNGLAVTKDGGVSWSYLDTGFGSESTARYAAFPTEDTWYVSSGYYPPSSSKNSFSLTSCLSIDKQSGKFTWEKPLKAGAQGAISKTTDGGKTFKIVHSVNGYYFNQINCADTETCIAVMETGSHAVAIMTTDGGKTWKTVVDDGDATLLCVKMITTKEAWVGGGRGFFSERKGHFFHTTDGGATWDEVELDGGICMDIAFAEGSSVGYSTVSTMQGYSMATYS